MIKGTENLAVGDLISRRVPFAVPIYQRAYAWEAEEVGDFVSDIGDLFRLRLREQSTDKKEHFFGGPGMRRSLRGKYSQYESLRGC